MRYQTHQEKINAKEAAKNTIRKKEELFWRNICGKLTILFSSQVLLSPFNVFFLVQIKETFPIFLFVFMSFYNLPSVLSSCFTLNWLSNWDYIWISDRSLLERLLGKYWKFNQIVYINFTKLILTHKFVTIHFPIFLHWCLFCSSLRLSWDNWDDNDGEDGDEGEVTDREAGTEEAELLGLSDQSPVSL